MGRPHGLFQAPWECHLCEPPTVTTWALLVLGAPLGTSGSPPISLRTLTPQVSTKLQSLGLTGLKSLLSKVHSLELIQMDERMTKDQREERERASHRPTAARASGKGGAPRAGSLRRRRQHSREAPGGPQETCRQW